MKKQLLCAALAAGMSIAPVMNAFAQDKPKIMSAEREIYLQKPEGEFVNGVFMIPVRRLCSALGASCDWYEDKQGIIINSKDNITRLFLYIGNDELQIFTFTAIADGTNEYVKLDAPLKIVDNRTLVPFEQICKALKAEYEWSEDKSTIIIKSDEEITDEPKLGLSISADKEDVSKDDLVEISIKAENINLYDGYNVGGYSAAVIYDKSQFEFVSSCMTDCSGEKFDAMGVDNPDFSNDSIKAVYVSVAGTQPKCDTPIVGKVVLKALSDDGGKIRLSDRIGNVGYDTSIILLNREDVNDIVSLEKASKLNINISELELK